MRSALLFGPSLVAVGLAVRLFWRPKPISGGAYRLVCLFAFLALISLLFRPDYETVVFFGPHPLAFLKAGLYLLVGITPLTLVVEIGVSGYLGFSSMSRSLILLITALGTIFLIVAFFLARIWRH
jgi:hypothetical protein